MMHHLQTLQSYFHPWVSVFLHGVLLWVGRGSQAEMNHVCPRGVGAFSSAGAAAAVCEPSWTELIGHMLPGLPVCLALERATQSSLNNSITRGFSVNIWFADPLIKLGMFIAFSFYEVKQVDTRKERLRVCCRDQNVIHGLNMFWNSNKKANAGK